MAITASMVKELRDSTGAGMMDAKKALTENDGDMEAAVDWLRTKGLAKAAKKSGRTAAEGLVAVTMKDGTAVAVEVNSETDFVAKNADFQSMVGAIAGAALTVGDVDALKNAEVDGKSVADTLTDKIATIGENSANDIMAQAAVAQINFQSITNKAHQIITQGVDIVAAMQSQRLSENILER